MIKRIECRAVHLSWAFIFFSVSLLFAQQTTEPPPNNTFTMTTYYPAPFGAYKKLTVYDSVGIGTTDPMAKLDVRGRILIQTEGTISGNPLYPFIHTTDPNMFIDPTNAGEQAPVLSSTGIVARSGETPVNNTWTGYDFDGTSSVSGFVAARIAAQFPTLGSDVIDTNLLFLIRGTNGFQERMRITSNGNVGIGTTNPTSNLTISGPEAKLLVDRTGGGQFSAMAQFQSRNPEPPYVEWFHDRNGINPVRYGYIQGGDFGSSKELRFYTENNANFTFLNGNVGIGTTMPNAPLDVFKSDSSATNNPGNPAIRVTATTGVNSEFLSLGYDATLNKGYIQAAQAGVAWEDLLLNPKGGNVGIGTTNPAAMLTIGSSPNTNGSALYVAKNETNVTPLVRFQNLNNTGSNSYGLDIFTGGTDGAYGLWVRSNGGGAYQTNLIVENSGKVGIGVEYPQAKLDIGGTAGVDGIRFPDGSLQTKAAKPTISGPFSATPGASTNLNQHDICMLTDVYNLVSNNSYFRCKLSKAGSTWTLISEANASCEAYCLDW